MSKIKEKFHENKDSFKRMGEIVSVLKKYDANKGIAPEDAPKICEDLGSTFIKIGQMLSMRYDLLPEEYCRALEGLRSDISPVDFPLIDEVIREELGDDYQLIESIDETPIGSASIGQVHKAKLKTGEEVVIKVQKPGVEEVMTRDLRLLRKAAMLLDKRPGSDKTMDFSGIVEQMKIVTLEELDFLNEATNTIEFSEIIANDELNECPKVYKELSTSNILTLECINGFSVGDKDRLIAKGYNLDDIGKIITRNYIDQILVHGFFHADPHSGNIWVRDHKAVWLDFGMVGRLSETDKITFKTLCDAIISKDIQMIQEIVISFDKTAKVDHSVLYADIERMVNLYASSSAENVNSAQFINEIFTIAKEQTIKIPSQYTLLGRSLMTIEGLFKDLSPSMDFMEMLTEFFKEQAMANLNIEEEVIKAFSTIKSTVKNSTALLNGLSTLVGRTIKGETSVQLDLSKDEKTMKTLVSLIRNVTLSVLVSGAMLSSAIFLTAEAANEHVILKATGYLGYFIGFIMLLVLAYKQIFKKK